MTREFVWLRDGARPYKLYRWECPRGHVEEPVRTRTLQATLPDKWVRGVAQ